MEEDFDFISYVIKIALEDAKKSVKKGIKIDSELYRDMSGNPIKETIDEKVYGEHIKDTIHRVLRKYHGE